MPFVLNHLPYRVINHNEIKVPTIYEGKKHPEGEVVKWQTVQWTDKVIFIKSKIAIYNEQSDQTLVVEEVTPFLIEPGMIYPNDRNSDEYLSFISELLFMNQSYINYVLMERSQRLPDSYEKFRQVFQPQSLEEIFRTIRGVTHIQ